MAESIRTAVVGAGKMGGIHSKVLSKLPESELTAIVDVDANKAKQLAEQHGCGHYTDYRELVGKVDAVTISTPTMHHTQIAKFFIENNVPVLIEKPLASNVDEGAELIELAEKNNVTVAVGHSERCNPVAQAMKRLEIEPKFIEANRISPYPFRSMDVGVVLDVMIHDIDIILSLAAAPIKSVQAVGVNVIADHEDICNARITFENGCIANVTASRLALKFERKVRVFSRQAYLSLDYLKKEGIVIQAAPNIDVVQWVKEHQDGDFDFSDVNWPELLNIEQLDIDDREPLRVEQESFLQSLLDRSKRPEVTGREGLEALRCAQLILDAIKEHSWD